MAATLSSSAKQALTTWCATNQTSESLFCGSLSITVHHRSRRTHIVYVFVNRPHIRAPGVTLRERALSRQAFIRPAMTGRESDRIEKTQATSSMTIRLPRSGHGLNVSISCRNAMFLGSWLPCFYIRHGMTCVRKDNHIKRSARARSLEMCSHRFPSLFVVAFRRFLKETDPLRSLQLNLALLTKCFSPTFPTCPLSRS